MDFILIIIVFIMRLSEGMVKGIQLNLFGLVENENSVRKYNYFYYSLFRFIMKW